MFRKAQMKLFAIITCILLAIFIAVLGSINLIMQAMMQRQSLDVLKKIASGVEYSNGFVITRPEDFGQKSSEPPPKPPETTTTAETTTSTSTTTLTETDTETESTAAETTTPAVQPAIIETTFLEPTVEDTEAPPAETEEVIPETESETPPEEQPKVTAAAPEPTSTQQPVQTTVTEPAKRPPATTAPAHPPTEQKPTEPTTQYEWWQDPNNWGQMPTYPNPWGEGGGYYPPYVGPFYPPYQNWNYNNLFPQLFSNKQTTTGPAAETTITAATTEPETSVIENLAYTGETTESVEFIDEGAPEPNKSPDEQRKKNDDKIPRSLGSIDFFIVMADKDGNYIDMLNNDELDEATAQNYISAILKEKVSSGMIDNKYQFYQVEKNNGTLMVFTDKSAEFNMLSKLIRTTIIIGTISFIFLAAAAFFLSKKIMQPLKSAFEKQKQFISDASHELKTPLTVISTNADVLSGEIGENRWLTYIKSQTDRMNVLVNDLLNLTRLENNSSEFKRTDFDLSKAIVNTALPFECQAFESNKEFIVDVEEGLTINGSERHIKQMAAIFIDNALKYSNEGGTVKVGLRKQGDKKLLSVYNTGKGIKASEKDKIFERFYRSDSSRNRATGGYGLGLAIAKSIIDKHKFKIYVDSEEGKSICFIITM